MSRSRSVKYNNHCCTAKCSDLALCLQYLNEHDVSIVGAPVVEGMGDQPVGFSVLLSALKVIYDVVACHDHHVLCPKRQGTSILDHIYTQI